MFHSILITTLRQFTRNLSFSVISISGLVVGLTTSILVFLWVAFELSYDQQDPSNDRTFTILTNTSLEGEIETSDEIPNSMTDFLATNVPEVESVTRIDGTRSVLTHGNKSASKYGQYADAEYFKVFNARIIAGNQENPFPDNNSIFLSERMAGLLFDDGDALGKVISVDNKTDFKVTGVFADFPANSSFNAVQYVLPFYSRSRDAEDWRPTFIKLHDASSQLRVQKKLDSKLTEVLGEGSTTTLLFCLTDWRLHWSFENGKVSGGRIVYVIIFAITALFILIMACVNYMNIATAGAAKRAREIGVRKMTGATRATLIRQFMVESLAMTFAAAVVSLCFAYLLLPLFNQLIGEELSLTLSDPILLTGLFGITLFTGLLAGSYPALLLSSLKPAIVLKGNLYSGLTGAGLRKALVIFQFTLSVMLIFCALVMQEQIEFMLKKDLGFDKNNVLIIDEGIPLNSFKSEALANPTILSVGVSDSSPIEINGAGEVHRPGNPNDQPLVFNGSSIDEDFLPTIGLEFVQGRNFSPTIPSDSVNFIITQSGADLLGFQDPIGQTVKFNMYHNYEGKIIGVIKDFHNEDIHIPTKPVIFSYRRPENSARIFVRYQAGELDAALGHIKSVFDKFQPGVPMQYGFLDQDFENQFYQEKLFRKFTICFTVIGVAIACLGLLGLTMFNAQRRTKEIAIRKVLGATISQIMTLLYREFGKPVMISFLVAFPMAYFLMMRFLETYPFRVTISVFAFAIVAVVMIGIVILTVSFQSFKAAVKNPVDSLKIE
jgi:putative ABC transport system permease protein